MVPDRRIRTAAFATGSHAVIAWRDWAATKDLNALAAPELRLLPQVYRNLRSAGIPDDEIEDVVKQTTRSLWIRTRLLMRQAAQTIERFSAEGLSPLLLKGAALIARGDTDAQTRYMSDFDLLVREEEAERAYALLMAGGWQPVEPLTAGLLSYRHAMAFHKGEFQCDLHWRPMWDAWDTKSDHRLRALAELQDLDGVPVRVPRASDLLIHLIMHGTRAFDVQSVRWIGDALAMIRSGSIDWSAVQEEATARQLAYPVGDALRFLREEFAAAIPDEVIRTLQAQPVSRSRRRSHRIDPDEPAGDDLVAWMRAIGGVALRRRDPMFLFRSLRLAKQRRSLPQLAGRLLTRILNRLRRG
jgi:hypothetical protein